jgi:uncharacterized SAM-binding protein YcdF (DUF218 family)
VRSTPAPRDDPSRRRHSGALLGTRGSGSARPLRWLGAGALVLLVLGGFTPLANGLNGWMGGPAELRPAEAIVVPGRGGADTDEVLTNRSLRRTMLAISLYRRGLAPLLVLSGHGGEVEARIRLAQGLGIPTERIVPARGANTTREESAVLERLLRPRGITRVLLVADPIDMPRTRALLERRGFTVLGAPTAGSGPGDPESRLHLLREIGTELAACVYYRLRGWI